MSTTPPPPEWHVYAPQDVITDQEFARYNELAWRVADLRRIQHPKQPVKFVTNRVVNLPDHQQPGARKHIAQGTVGITWPATGHIWLDTTRSHAYVAETALHEIAHAYQHSDNHGAKWRMFFGWLLVLWHREHGISERDSRVILYQTLASYNRQRGDHDTWMTRVLAERDKIWTSSHYLWTKTKDIW